MKHKESTLNVSPRRHARPYQSIYGHAHLEEHALVLFVGLGLDLLLELDDGLEVGVVLSLAGISALENQPMGRTTDEKERSRQKVSSKTFLIGPLVTTSSSPVATQNTTHGGSEGVFVLDVGHCLS